MTNRNARKQTMPPRIRSFLRRPPYAREAKSPARSAPGVFREFVETLQRLDPARRAAAGSGAAMSKRAAAGSGAAMSKRAAEGSGAATSKRAAPVLRGCGRRRRQSGNGHARPRGANGRSRPQ